MDESNAQDVLVAVSAGDLKETDSSENALIKQFRVKTSVSLNYMDKSLRTVFHHLACALDFGSFGNTNICKLLCVAFNQLSNSGSLTKLPPLGDFLKRIDSDVKSA